MCPDSPGFLLTHCHLDRSVLWSVSTCVSTSPCAQWHLLPGLCPFSSCGPLPPTAGAALGPGPGLQRVGTPGGARPTSGPLCSRHFPGAQHGNFLNDLQIFLGSHLMFLGLVAFLLIMFHSGISQLCVENKTCCKRRGEVWTSNGGTKFSSALEGSG